MADSTFGGLKDTMIDHAHATGKAASLTAESFSLNQSTIHTAINSHEASITHLDANFKSLEQQVKAIARVMASQNVSQIAENAKLSQEDLSRSLTQYVDEKRKETLALVQRELIEVGDAKSGLGKKIDMVEQRLMGIFGAKLEEASTMRHAMRDELEKIRDMIGDVPDVAEKHVKLIKALETRQLELKNEFREFSFEQEKANMEQDKQVAILTADSRATLNKGMDELAEATKSLGKSVRKHEVSMEDRLKNLTDLIETETKDRMEMFKGFPKLVVDRVDKAKLELERKIDTIEPDVDRKVRPIATGVQELKRMIDEESVHRDTADKDLSRNLAKEMSDRHHDEARLVSLISTCQATVAQMHKI